MTARSRRTGPPTDAARSDAVAGELPPRPTTVYCAAPLPEDAEVSVSGLGILRRFAGTDSAGPSCAPVIRIRGLAVWGAVMVTRKPTLSEPEPRQLER